MWSSFVNFFFVCPQPTWSHRNCWVGAEKALKNGITMSFQMQKICKDRRLLLLLNTLSCCQEWGLEFAFLMVMKADVVISPAALACSWIWLWAQTRDLHVCLRGFPSGPGFLPRHKDMQASLTCKSLFLQVDVFGTWEAKPPNQSVPMGIWTKRCAWLVFCSEFFFFFF